MTLAVGGNRSVRV